MLACYNISSPTTSNILQLELALESDTFNTMLLKQVLLL